MARPETVTYTPSEASTAGGIDDWRVLLRSLHASFRTGSMATGVALAARIVEAADAADHHPDLTITYPRVHVSLTTHETDGLTNRDLDLARTISTLAAELGVSAEAPSVLSVLEIGIDALDIPAVRPFWEAVLGYRSGSDGGLVDPYGRGPAFWFQAMDSPRTQRNRIHVDVLVPHDVAAERIAGALAAGGTLVSDDRAPAFWVLADPEGNEACVSTWQGRD